MLSEQTRRLRAVHARNHWLHGVGQGVVPDFLGKPSSYPSASFLGGLNDSRGLHQVLGTVIILTLIMSLVTLLCVYGLTSMRHHGLVQSITMTVFSLKLMHMTCHDHYRTRSIPVYG